MPKSKRNKVVHLNKTKKKDKQWKEGIIQSVRNCIDNYPDIYLFQFFNMRNEKFKELRDQLKDSSRFIMGSNKMLQVALGRSEADEARPGLSSISAQLTGHVGLLFTKLPQQEVQALFEEFHHEDYARAGCPATHGVQLSAGPLHGGPAGAPLSHTLEPLLRKHGMPTKLNKGVVELVSDYVVCKQGQALDSNQVALLRVFDIKMATFRLRLLARWSSEGEAVEQLAEAVDGEGGSEEEGDEGEDMEGDVPEFTFPEADGAVMLPAHLRK